MKDKPCLELKYCPYGALVEQFDLNHDRGAKSCGVFGHDCPVFVVAEDFVDTGDGNWVNRRNEV